MKAKPIPPQIEASAWIPPVEDPKDGLVREFLVVVGRMEAAAAKMEAHAGSDAAINRGVAELVRSADRLVARRHRRFMLLVALGVVITSALTAGGTVWWLAPGTTYCVDGKAGGQFCGRWVIPERRN